MIDMTFESTGDYVWDAILQSTRKANLAAAAHLRRRMQEVLSQNDNTGPSAPNEIPHMQSNEAYGRGRLPLAQTVEVYDDAFEDDEGFEVDVAVGTASQHAMWLELGTRTMRPRPAWERTAEEESDEMAEIQAREFEDQMRQYGLEEVDDPEDPEVED